MGCCGVPCLQPGAHACHRIPLLPPLSRGEPGPRAWCRASPGTLWAGVCCVLVKKLPAGYLENTALKARWANNHPLLRLPPICLVGVGFPPTLLLAVELKHPCAVLVPGCVQKVHRGAVPRRTHGPQLRVAETPRTQQENQIKGESCQQQDLHAGIVPFSASRPAGSSCLLSSLP